MLNTGFTCLPNSAISLAAKLPHSAFTTYVICLYLAQRGQRIDRALISELTGLRPDEVEAAISTLCQCKLLERRGKGLRVADSPDYGAVDALLSGGERERKRGDKGGRTPKAGRKATGVVEVSNTPGLFDGVLDNPSPGEEESSPDRGDGTSPLLERGRSAVGSGESHLTQQVSDSPDVTGEDHKGRGRARARARLYTQSQRNELVKAIADFVYGARAEHSRPAYQVANGLLTHITEKLGAPITLEQWQAYAKHHAETAPHIKPSPATVKGAQLGFLNWLATQQAEGEPEEQENAVWTVALDPNGAYRLVRASVSNS